MTIKEIRALTGLSQAAFAERYNIPKRSIENWETTGAGHREPPEYVVDLLERVVKADLQGGKEMSDNKYYYWIDFNDASGKVVLYRLAYDADGHRDPDTEEPIYSKPMEDIDGLKEAEASGDIDRAYEILDADIEKQLGYLPDYEVG